MQLGQQVFIPDSNNLHLLKNILQSESKDGKQLPLREMALYSLSEYKNKRAVKLIQAVKDSNSELSELAEALMQKINQSLEKDSNYFLDLLIKPVKEKVAYIALRNKYVEGFKDFSNTQKNNIDLSLIPFRKILASIVKDDSKFIVLNDTITASYKETRGQRFGYGFFYDSANGVGGDNIVISKPTFTDNLLGPSTTKHEWGHVVHRYIDEHRPEVK